jgi:hypothetical protein
MGTKRITRVFRDGDIVDRCEYHDGRYGAPGQRREKKKKLTEEQVRKINQYNKVQKCRHKLLTYIQPSDLWVTWTYEVERRPADMKKAKKHFAKAMRKVRGEYHNKEQPLYWFRNIERGTKGAWHIHMVINAIDGAEGILRSAWEHGGVYIEEIRLNDKLYDEDFTKLANYLTKDEYTSYEKADGTPGKPRIKEASYNTSRNMPLKKPRTEHLVRWKEEAKPMKGYYILRIHEGINPVTGYKYRRYTMARLTPESPKVRKKRE